jgi:IMP dehydrogenase
VRFLDDRVPAHDLTYDDVFMVPRHSGVGSRYDVDLATSDGTGATVPLVVANMTAIAGKRMAETVARRGGLTVIPQDIPLPVVTDVVAWVKSRHLVLDTPIELTAHQTVGEALSLIPKRSHGAAVVVEDGRPVGLVTEADCAEVDRFAQVGAVMARHLVVVDAATGPREVFDRIDGSTSPLAVAVDEDGRLAGVLTRLGALRAALYEPAVDGRGRLSLGAAVGVNGDVAARAQALLDAGVDCLVVDTDAGGAGRGAVAGPVGPRRRRERRLRRGHPGAGRRRGRHRQGRGGAGRDVHDPDDDRRRSSPVHRRRRVCGGGRTMGAPRLG